MKKIRNLKGHEVQKEGIKLLNKIEMIGHTQVILHRKKHLDLREFIIKIYGLEKKIKEENYKEHGVN